MRLLASSSWWEIQLPHNFQHPLWQIQIYKMPFGLHVAGDAFRCKLDAIYSNLKGVTGIADDIFIYSTSNDDHNQNLTDFLNRTREHGLKIGLDKMQYKRMSFEFCGSQFTTQGHKPMNKKIQDIQLMPELKDIKQLQSFLGMINYLNWYSPRLAEITSSLQDLTKENVPFTWGPEHTDAFCAAKQEIATGPLLAYYDPKKPPVLQTDASNYGLGCVILQHGKPVAYASKALQAHTQGYVALQKEALAVAWALEKHHHCLYGHGFTLKMDQKCPETILNRSIVESSPRLQCIITWCIPYHFKVKYIKGKDNVLADCMSCLPAGSDILSTSQINLKNFCKLHHSHNWWIHSSTGVQWTWLPHGTCTILWNKYDILQGILMLVLNHLPCIVLPRLLSLLRDPCCRQTEITR